MCIRDAGRELQSASVRLASLMAKHTVSVLIARKQSPREDFAAMQLSQKAAEPPRPPQNLLTGFEIAWAAARR